MTRNEYERTIQNQKQTIDQLETKLRELGEQFAEAAKAPPEGCKRGAWCRACGWNKPIVVRFNGVRSARDCRCLHERLLRVLY